MKKLLLSSLVFLCALYGYSESMSGDEILAFVRTKLPKDPLKLTGSLKVKEKNGFTRSNMPVVMELDWGAEIPLAKYRIDKETLTITWNNEKPSYTFSNPENLPTSDILGTGITWADLSFSVLWWPNAKLIDEGKKINRDCYVVDVPVPDSKNTMRLWIEKNMGMLLEAKTLDARKRELTRLKIVSIKKMDGMWVAKDLELRDKKTGSKTTLQISDLEWKNGPPQVQETVAAFDPAESVNTLAFDLYKKLAPEQKGNLFFSPYSISSALAMTYGGARSETAEQMNSTLHFGGPGATHPAFSCLRKKINGIQEKGHVQLNVANSLWPQEDYKFLPDYLAMTREFYGVEIEAVDYKGETEAARLRINNWVEAKTMDRIQNLLPEGSVDSFTRLVLANAIYFKGNWAEQFDKKATRDTPFKIKPGKEVKVPMMSQKGDFKLASTKDFQALELPYEGGDLSMIVLLSNEADKLPVIGNETLSGLQFNEQEVMVQLPKFKIESSFSLNKTLKELGMPLAFSDHADFSGMDGSRELYITDALHKAFVEVNEEGTEAAAATGVVMARTSMPPQFVADHPFLFLIRENSTGMILFMGRVMNPSK